MNRKFLSKPYLLLLPTLLFLPFSSDAAAGPKNSTVIDPVALTIIIDGCDSGVTDIDGTMNGQIISCGEGAVNHGAFVSCVAHLTNTWKKEGLINGQAKGAIQRCAASANIPPVSDTKCKIDADCDDGLYCNGTETCIDKACQPGIPVACADDGLFCNGVESCDEASDSCMSGGDPCIPPSVCNEDFDICGCGSDADCDDGVFCNGPEACAGGECQPGTPVDCPDNGLFCDGTEYCDENGDACASSGDPCEAPNSCDEAGDNCILIECGNAIQDPGEQCDDGNVLNGDCCNSECQFEPASSLCSDGVYCNGAETCDSAGVCLAGMPVDCSDGIACTVDACDETSDVCIHDPDSTSCDDLQYCNGIEVCDPLVGCQPGTPVDCPDDGAFCTGTEYCNENADTCASTDNPCQPGYVCNEVSDTCDPEVVCGNGAVEQGEECDDGNTEGGDCCSATCTFEAAGSPCPDIEYCDGAEACDGNGVCLDTTPVDCNDDVACTVDACDETADTCVHTPDNEYCSDGQYCNGVEVCDPLADCQPGTPVDCPDDGAFCDGTEICDEESDSCVGSGDPCFLNGVCDEEKDACQTVLGSSLKRMFLIWKQGR
jgi:cysteine-rich repeat protein